MHNRQSLYNDLSAMNLDPAGTAFMHSSMKAIGPVDGGADTVLDALCEYFANGLIALPTHTWKTCTAENPFFDVLHTRSCVGLLPELFRARTNVVRSWHPTHSVAAYGRDAYSFTAGDERFDTPCARGSAWGRLHDRDATILLVGCDLKRLTYLHGVEEWVDVPNRLDEMIPFTVRTPDGREISAPARPHRGQPSEQFDRAEEILYAAGAIREGKLGDAKVLLVDARRTRHAMAPVLKAHPELFDGPDS